VANVSPTRCAPLGFRRGHGSHRQRGGGFARRSGGPLLMFDGTWTPWASRIVRREARPFGAEIENGSVYGLGAGDMKGALASMVYAGKLLLDAHVPSRVMWSSRALCRRAV